MKQVISELVAINHDLFTFESDIFTIEIYERNRLKIFPRSVSNSAFYRISQISKVLNDAGWTWYASATRTGKMEVTAWDNLN